MWRRALIVCAAAALAGAVAASGVHAAAPAGATAKCRDGTYSYSQHRSGTCSHHGGVAVWLTGTATSGSSAAPASCGVERWAVKTLQDRPSLLAAQATTVHYLVSRPAPASIASTRLPFERHVFTVVAAVVLVRAEADSDLHLVLAAGGQEMIAESPSPSCDPNAPAAYRGEITSARAAVRVCARARLTGVAFFDFDHGQTGVAPNAIELHPILAFHCLSG